VAEEFYRLVRSGSAKRSLELLVETRLLDVLVPELAAALRSDRTDAEHRMRTTRFWAYVAALDTSTAKRNTPPSNALVLAVLLMPVVRDALHPDSTAIPDVSQLVADVAEPILDRLKASRRDGDLARQILLTTRFIFPSSNPKRRRPRLSGLECFEDALRLHEIVSEAEAVDPGLVGQPQLAPEGTSLHDEEALAREIEELAQREQHGRTRYGHGRREPQRDRAGAAPSPSSSSSLHVASVDGAAVPASWESGTVRTAIPDPGPPHNLARPVFLGAGTFRRWGAIDEI
jgi:hypothetical protein